MEIFPCELKLWLEKTMNYEWQPLLLCLPLQGNKAKTQPK